MSSIRDMEFGQVGTLDDGRLIICHKDPRLSPEMAAKQRSKCWSIIIPDGVCIYFHARGSGEAVTSVMLHSETFGENHEFSINAAVTICGQLMEWRPTK